MVKYEFYPAGSDRALQTGLWGSGRFDTQWSIDTANQGTFLVKVGAGLRNNAGQCDNSMVTYGDEFAITFDTTIIQAPSRFKLQSNNYGGYQFNWSSAFGAIGYNIEGTLNEGLSWFDVGYFNANDLVFNGIHGTTVPAGTLSAGSHIYRIRSCASQTDCALVTKTSSVVYVGGLPRPTQVTATLVDEHVRISWNQPISDYLTALQVGYIDDAGMYWSFGGTTPTSQTSLQILLTQLHPQEDGHYYLFVRGLYSINGIMKHGEPVIVVLTTQPEPESGPIIIHTQLLGAPVADNN